jgi:glycosyltransferase involved in cell wall biosynthesis
LKKLAIITTHPIQYYAPVFKLLNQRKRINIKVFYTWGQTSLQKHDPGFGKQVEWDIPLLEGYDYEWAINTSPRPGSHHSKGIINPGLIAQIGAYQPDAILIFGWNYHSHLKAMRYFKNKVPVYFRGDSTLLDEQGGLKSLLKTIYLKWVYRHIDHAFYVGTNNKAYFKKYGLKDKQLSFAPHAVDNDRFATSRQVEVTELRKNVGIGIQDRVILFAGKFEEKKMPQLLLNAFLLINNQALHLLFVGNGVLEDQLRKQAAGHANIHFLNFQNQSYMPVIYQACDLFCLPSKGPGETWGLAVNEAMACGKAVLVSDQCGCAVDLVTKTNGIICKSGDIDEITLGLKKITANTTDLKAMGRQSALLIKDWKFEHIAAAIENKLLNEI